MRTLVVDASTLVAELMRERGRALLSRASLEFLVSERAWSETARGLRERANILRHAIRRSMLTAYLKPRWVSRWLD